MTLISIQSKGTRAHHTSKIYNGIGDNSRVCVAYVRVNARARARWLASVEIDRHNKSLIIANRKENQMIESLVFDLYDSIYYIISDNNRTRM